MLSLVQRGYRKLVPTNARANFWHLRNRFRRELGGLLYRLNGRGRCCICGGKNLVRFKNPVVAQLLFCFYRCQNCDFIFVAPTPNLSTVYPTSVPPEFGAGEEIWNGHYLKAIDKYASRRGKLLEIGFGNASFLKLAQADGWEVYGAELSEVLVRAAREEFKLLNVGLGTIEELAYPDNSFDVVAGFNFLEHVPDPRKTLAEIRRILLPGGLLVVMCPNIAGIYHLLMPEILGENDPLKITWVPPEHLSYFNKTNLGMLLADAGFVVVGDESHLMSSLWLQFEVNIGPRVSAEKFARLVSKIQASPIASGDPRVAEYRQEIKNLLVERMTWKMLSDLIELEPLLGAEVGILLLAKKSSS